MLIWITHGGCKIWLGFCKLMWHFTEVISVYTFYYLCLFWFNTCWTLWMTTEWELMEPRVPVTIEARLGYRNKGDPEDEWKEYAKSTEIRTMDCSPPNVDIDFSYICFKSILTWWIPTLERWIPLQLLPSTTIWAWSFASWLLSPQLTIPSHLWKQSWSWTCCGSLAGGHQPKWRIHQSLAVVENRLLPDGHRSNDLVLAPRSVTC